MSHTPTVQTLSSMPSTIQTRSFRALARTYTFLVAVSLLGALAGCDSSSDDPAPLAPGTFDARLDGAGLDDVALDGLAAFEAGIEGETGETVFAIGLVEGDSAHTVVLVGRGTPRARAYPLTANDETGEAGAFYVRSNDADGTLYMATSGTLTLTDVAADRLRGRFDLVAVALLDASDRVTLSGSFDAPRGEVEPASDAR